MPWLWIWAVLGPLASAYVTYKLTLKGIIWLIDTGKMGRFIDELRARGEKV